MLSVWPRKWKRFQLSDPLGGSVICLQLKLLLPQIMQLLLKVRNRSVKIFNLPPGIVHEYHTFGNSLMCDERIYFGYFSSDDETRPEPLNDSRITRSGRKRLRKTNTTTASSIQDAEKLPILNSIPVHQLGSEVIHGIPCISFILFKVFGLFFRAPQLLQVQRKRLFPRGRPGEANGLFRRFRFEASSCARKSLWRRPRKGCQKEIRHPKNVDTKLCFDPPSMNSICHHSSYLLARRANLKTSTM